jgi:O-antigen ligase
VGVGIVALLALFVATAPLSWVTVAFGATTAFVLALRFPWLAWLGLAFLLPIASGLRIGPASLTDLAFAGAVALWCGWMVSGRRRVVRPPIPLWPIVVYVTAPYLATLGASDLDEALTEMVKWIEFGVLLALLPLALPPKVVPWLVVALLGAAALQGLYGLYQFIFRIGPDWFLIQGRFMRASGVFGQPNPFGGYLGLSLPVAISLTLWSVTTLWKRWNMGLLLMAALCIGSALAIGVGLIASWSRGGWLGAAGATVVVLALYDRRTALLLALGTLVLTVTALVGALNPTWIPTAISSRVDDIPAYLGLVDVLTLEVNDDNFAVVERVAHWVAAIRMWEMAPWLGVGPGNYATLYPLVALPRWSDPLGHAHNIYLNVLGESGIVGLAAFATLWATLISWLLRHIWVTLPRGSWQRALAVGVMGVVAHLTIHNVFDNLFVQGMYLHVAFWLGAVAVATQLFSTDRISSREISESDG